MDGLLLDVVELRSSTRAQALASQAPDHNLDSVPGQPIVIFSFIELPVTNLTLNPNQCANRREACALARVNTNHPAAN